MKLVVEALLIIYLFYLGSELILVDIRKPFRSSTCLMRYSRSLSSCAFTAGSCAAESPQLVQKYVYPPTILISSFMLQLHKVL
jgi:hypothetical protein